MVKSNRIGKRNNTVRQQSPVLTEFRMEMKRSVSLLTGRKVKTLFFSLLLILFSSDCFSQNQKSTLRDTLDNKLDASHYLVNMNGFIPLPIIISEPALGNFGGALALIFISP